MSNWYVRLCRRRFWKGDYTTDKISAYQTLYTCLETVARLSAPVAPFFMDRLFNDLNLISGKDKNNSVHLALFTQADDSLIDLDLEQRMGIAQKVTSMILALRKKEQIKVRQPLQRIMVPVLDPTFKRQLTEVQDLILSEVNVKEIEYLEDTTGVLVKRIKADFKKLGPKFGKQMKQVASAIAAMDQDAIATLERNQTYVLIAEGNEFSISTDDVEITTNDIPGWLVATEGAYTVALDINISSELKEEGIARELVNRIQNLRKDNGFEVTDKIRITVQKHTELDAAIEANKKYICLETLADNIIFVDNIANESHLIELDTNLETQVSLEKI